MSNSIPGACVPPPLPPTHHYRARHSAKAHRLANCGIDPFRADVDIMDGWKGWVGQGHWLVFAPFMSATVWPHHTKSTQQFEGLEQAKGLQIPWALFIPAHEEGTFLGQLVAVPCGSIVAEPSSRERDY